MQLLQGAPDALSSSEIPVDEVRRHDQLRGRLDDLVQATTKCRVEVNLTLRLLRSIGVADAALSEVTFNLNRAQQQVHKLRPHDQEQIRTVRSELEEQLIRSQALADTHVPALEQMASQHSHRKFGLPQR